MQSGWGLCRLNACMTRIQTQEWVRFVQVWCSHEKDPDAGKGEVCAGLMKAWEGFRRKSGWGLCRFDACMRRNQMQSGWGLCRLNACMTRIQTQEWVRFVQVWCSHEKDPNAGVGEVYAGLMQAWEGFKRKSEWVFCRFDACMRSIQTQEWVSFSQVWCLYEKDSDARGSEVCAGLMLVWEGFRRQSGRGLCRFDARMVRIGTQDWVRFVQVWCLYEKDSDAVVCEVYAGLMLVWEGFRRRCGWGFCRFDARMIRIETHKWVRFADFWWKHEKDSDARVGEVRAGLMLVWEEIRCRSGWGLCRLNACMRRIQTQEWVRFVQIWRSLEKDSDAGVSEVCAGLMQAWEGFKRKSEWVFCRFDACKRTIQTQEWVRFAQVFCKHEKDSYARVGEVCAGLMLASEGFRRRSGWGLCRFDANMRRIQTKEWVSFLQVCWLYDKDSDARVVEVCAGLILAW